MSTFPRIGIVGSGQFVQMMITPAVALGIEAVIFSDRTINSLASHVVGDFNDIAMIRKFADRCDLIAFEPHKLPLSIIKTLEREGERFLPTSETIMFSEDMSLNYEKLKGNSDFNISVMVSRSPHGQASSWAPTKIIRKNDSSLETITPVPEFNDIQSEAVQNLALKIAFEIGLVGVMAVELSVKNDASYVNKLEIGPHFSANWSIEGSVTSQYEQHLRAILDLPLGETSMNSDWAVMGEIICGDKIDMYRPYLHLMARTPNLKFHQYRNDVLPGNKIGHLTITGSDLSRLREEIDHALLYMNGAIVE